MIDAAPTFIVPARAAARALVGAGRRARGGPGGPGPRRGPAARPRGQGPPVFGRVRGPPSRGSTTDAAGAGCLRPGPVGRTHVPRRVGPGQGPRPPPAQSSARRARTSRCPSRPGAPSAAGVVPPARPACVPGVFVAATSWRGSAPCTGGLTPTTVDHGSPGATSPGGRGPLRRRQAGLHDVRPRRPARPFGTRVYRHT